MSAGVDGGRDQGTIIGPLFFVIYTNDLLQGKNCVSESLLFADENSFIISAEILKISVQCQIYLSPTSLNSLLPVSSKFRENEYDDIHNKEFITFCIMYWL